MESLIDENVPSLTKLNLFTLIAGQVKYLSESDTEDERIRQKHLSFLKFNELLAVLNTLSRQYSHPDFPFIESRIKDLIKLLTLDFNDTLNMRSYDKVTKSAGSDDYEKLPKQEYVSEVDEKVEEKVEDKVDEIPLLIDRRGSFRIERRFDDENRNDPIHVQIREISERNIIVDIQMVTSTKNLKVTSTDPANFVKYWILRYYNFLQSEYSQRNPKDLTDCNLSSFNKIAGGKNTDCPIDKELFIRVFPEFVLTGLDAMQISTRNSELRYLYTLALYNLKELAFIMKNQLVGISNLTLKKTTLDLHAIIICSY